MQVGLSHVVRVYVWSDFNLGESVFLEHVLDDPWCPSVGLVGVVSCSAVVESCEVSVSSVEVTVNAEHWRFQVMRHSVLVLREDSKDKIRLVNQERPVLRKEFLYSAYCLVEVENPNVWKRLSQDRH